MKIGLFITSQHHLDKNMVEALDEQIALVHMARDGGWDALYSGQHYLNEGNNKQFQLVPFLARLMPEAGDMRTGLGILLLNLHNPVYVAETVATLDIMARGNFVFGVGLGYRATEFDAFGVPKGERVSRFENYMKLVYELWSGEPVTFEDATCKLDGAVMNIRPVQQPGPPLWIAANNDAAIRRAARMGDTWFLNPHSTLNTLRRQMDIYHAELKRVGKPMPAELPLFREIYCAKDRATALREAGPYLSGKYRDYAKWGQDKAMPADESFDKEFDDLLNERFILGSPEECYEQLRPYWEAFPVSELVVRPHWAGMPPEYSRKSIDLISRELLPELRKI
jgi:alkanesulfonate monooxygenase SsuD/methylene tetrahydromethanopterin reductase-like flavin-dependent oxidoreductase (luciferase family)